MSLWLGQCFRSPDAAPNQAALSAAVMAAREIYQQPIAIDRRNHHLNAYQFFSALDTIAHIDTHIAAMELSAFAHHVENFRMVAEPNNVRAASVLMDLELAIDAWHHEILHRYAACEVFRNPLADELFGDEYWADEKSPQAH